jgi:hypothetical protein
MRGERQKMRFGVDKFSTIERVKREIVVMKRCGVVTRDESFFLISKIRANSIAIGGRPRP